MTTHSLEYVIDFHSHILPGIDDGSTDMEMSRQMLELSASQGIKVILATPHFYADRVSLDHFLKYRDSSLNSIRHFSENYGIKILAGAEVAYFSGMSTANGLDRLTVSGTSLLLLEMPFRPWTGDDIREVRNLIRIGIQPVIAHIERFYPCQRNKHMIGELFSLPVYVQINAEALLTWKTRRFILRLFREGKAHLLGSDCHNLSSRPPNLAQGRDTVKRKLGVEYLEQMDSLGRELVGEILSIS